MNTQEFEIVPPGKAVMLFPLFIGAVLPMIMLLVAILAAKGSRDWLPVLPAMLVLPLAACGLAWSLHRRIIRLSDAGLAVRRFPWPRPVKMEEFDLEQASLVDLDAHAELLPRFKIAGSRLPGYRSGLFRLRDGRRATVVLTDLRRVLALPRRNGTVILLSLVRPASLVQAMRRLRDDSGRGAR